MESVVGVFTSWSQAERACDELGSIGIGRERLNLLGPGTSREALAHVPTSESEQPGMGGAVGGLVGGAVGAAAGVHLGTLAATALVPGVGPVVTVGIAAAALFGAGGAAAGVAGGQALENELAHGVPTDELFFYEDALRSGRTVLIALVEDSQQAEAARAVLQIGGAETLDAARERWWLGLRSAERARYSPQPADFHREESTFRRGFEAALEPAYRGKSYDQAAEALARRFPDSTQAAFRRGFERGEAYYKSLPERDPNRGWIRP